MASLCLKRRIDRRCDGRLTRAQDDKDVKDTTADIEPPSAKVKFEIYGEEMIEKKVKSSGNSGRVYLPPNWVGHHVKIVRID